MNYYMNIAAAEAKGSNMGMIIAIAVVAVIALSIIAYYVMRMLKGKMKIILGQGAVASGEKIAGKLQVEVKKEILCDRMFIGLVGEREVRNRRSGSSNSTSTKWIEFYRDEADVLIDERLPAGFKETYEFSLDAPSESQVMSGAEAALKAADGMEDGAIKSVVKGVTSIAAMSNMRLQGRKRWKVISRLKTKGVDLAASKKIHVSVK